MTIDWKGVYPALTTKFTAADALDLPMFHQNLQAQLDSGVHGIILGGTLGEASVLSQQEKQQLVEFAVDKIGGRIPVILNIAEGSTKEALHQIKLAEEWGAAGLMILPPMRYGADERELTVWFRTLAEATSLPIMIYNNPVDYKTLVTLNVFEALQDCKNIQAVKESTRDITNVTRMRNRFGDRYKILCGVDTLAFEELCAGADGWVAGLVCAFPAETVALFRHIKNNEIETALSLYRWFMPLLELDIHPKLVQYIKLAETMAGIGSEYVRPPRLVLEGKERATITNIIDSALSNRPAIKPVRVHPAGAD